MPLVWEITASISGSGLSLTGSGTDNITITDSGGTEAEELGIATAPGGAGVGVPVVGASLGPKVTDLTPISALANGAGIDNSGLIIGDGTTTKTITWPAGGTVQDMLNAIKARGWACGRKLTPPELESMSSIPRKASQMTSVKMAATPPRNWGFAA